MYSVYLSGYATVRVTTGATISDESSIQTFTSITSNSAGQASTVVSIIVITAAPDSSSSSSTAVPTLAAAVASQDHTPAIIGGTLAGVAGGVIAAGLICYLLYRHHKNKALNKRTGVSSPPNSPIQKPGFKHVADAELDTHPNTVVELPTSSDPGELDATPTASPNPNNRVSAITTGENARWSAVSSLSPPRVHSLAPAASLQAISQQHYGPGQQSYLLAPGDTHRLYRPPSGTLPAIQISRSEMSLPLRHEPTTDGAQGGALRDDEAAQTVQSGEESPFLQQAHPTNQAKVVSKIEHTTHEVDDRKSANESIPTSESVNMNEGSPVPTSRSKKPSSYAPQTKRNSW